MSLEISKDVYFDCVRKQLSYEVPSDTIINEYRMEPVNRYVIVRKDTGKELGIHTDDRISQRHDKRLISHQGFCAEHGVTESELPSLARVEILERPPFEIQFLEQLLAASLPEKGDQFPVGIEVIFDRDLAGTGHEH